MISVGDTVKLSHSFLSFIRDFRGEKEYHNKKDSVMLVIDINDKRELTLLQAGGDMISLEVSDVQLFSKPL